MATVNRLQLCSRHLPATTLTYDRLWGSPFHRPAIAISESPRRRFRQDIQCSGSHVLHDALYRDSAT